MTTAQVGRPTMLNDDRQQRIVDAVRAGNYLKVAAQWAGVSERTLLGWLARGRAAQQLVDDHDEAALYCPDCDRDRTTEVADRNRAQARADTEYAEALDAWRRAAADLPDGMHRPEQPAETHAVLDACPTCRTDQHPATWALPAAEQPFVHFLQEVTRAETSAEVAAVTAWRSAFDSDWRAARDYLVRRRPDRWAATTRIQMTTEEAERRIDDALGEALAALTGDGDLLDDEVADALADLDLDTDAHRATGHDPDGLDQ